MGMEESNTWGTAALPLKEETTMRGDKVEQSRLDLAQNSQF